MPMPYNTTYGHDTHTIVWTSKNGLWTIERHDVYHRSGELASQKYTLIRPEGTNYLIGRDAIHYTPKYVQHAVARICQQ